MSNLVQVLVLMAIPAAVLLTCRCLNLRNARITSTRHPAAGLHCATADPSGRSGPEGASQTRRR